jgi:hypothetical protein
MESGFWKHNSVSSRNAMAVVFRLSGINKLVNASMKGNVKC